MHRPYEISDLLLHIKTLITVKLMAQIKSCFDPKLLTTRPLTPLNSCFNWALYEPQKINLEIDKIAK